MAVSLDLATPPSLSHNKHERLFGLMHQSLQIRRHIDFFLWIEGDLQYYLPNEVLLVAWGNFDMEMISLDVISAKPGARTGRIHECGLNPFIRKLHERWVGNGRSSYMLKFPNGVGETDHLSDLGDLGLDRCLRPMRSIIVHGIKDERSDHEVLYLVFNSQSTLPADTRQHLEILLPYLDASLRRVPLLPGQKTGPEEKAEPNAGGLSTREQEIMQWVKHGKTNQEIGMILNISIFTVKNHLQRIFKKLDVMNRAQAVANLGQKTIKHANAG